MKSCKHAAHNQPYMSLPLRERGLKSGGDGKADENINVAPLAGAWIEISSLTLPACRSHVAPLAGAWIEIDYELAENPVGIKVAPLAGAWIEIRRGLFWLCQS